MSDKFLILKREDGSQVHFYADGEMSITDQLNLPGAVILPSGEYRIAETGVNAVTIIAADDREIEIPAEKLTGALARIPSEIRASANNCEHVAPFHLRDDEDESLDDFPAHLSEKLRDYYNDNEFSSFETAYNFGQLIADDGRFARVQICNAYSNTVDLVEMIGMKLDQEEIDDIECRIIAASRKPEPAVI